MKWVIAELITDPSHTTEDESGGLVPYAQWYRRTEEFLTQADVAAWLLAHPGTFEARRLEDGTAAPDQDTGA